MHRKVVLHLGIHKTATTALQEFLERESRSLRDNGAVYIPLAEMREEISPLIRSNQPLHREFLIKMAERMGAASIILSDENIAGLTSDICSGVLYPYAGGGVHPPVQGFRRLVGRHRADGEVSKILYPVVIFRVFTASRFLPVRGLYQGFRHEEFFLYLGLLLGV